MPLCGNCTQACNCRFDESGTYVQFNPLGRASTQMEGDGSEANPFVIHFNDQKEFRPSTAEFSYNDQMVLDNVFGTTVGFVGPIPRGSVIYESPVSFVIVDTGMGFPRYAAGNYWYVGATVTFAERADSADNTRKMHIISSRGPTPTPVMVAGHTTIGGGSDPVTMSCEGFVPGVFTTVPGIETVLQQFDIYVYQDSGSPLGITDIRLWITQI